VIVLILSAVLGVLTAVGRFREAAAVKRQADERRRASMREVAEKWHFREWEREVRSSDSV
jgi:hypothetical protein